MNKNDKNFVEKVKNGILFSNNIDDTIAIQRIYQIYFQVDNEDRDELYKINPLINDYYEKHKKKFAKCMLFAAVDEELWSTVEQYADTMVEILDELMKEQQCSFTDIRIAGKGFFNNVYSIGEKILKVGSPRASYSVPNHPRLLQPFIRENFTDKNGNPVICIEIAEKVLKVNPEDFDPKILYKIYKELREAGILWADARVQNIGILKRENLPTYNGESFINDQNFVGMRGKINSQDILQERRMCGFRY